MSKGDTYMDDNGVVWTEFSDGRKVILFDTIGERRCVSRSTWGDMDMSYSGMSRHDNAMMAWTASIAVILIALLAMAVLCE